MEKSGKPLRHAGLRGVKVQAGKDFLRGIGGDTVSFQLYTPHDSSCCTLPIRDENRLVKGSALLTLFRCTLPIRDENQYDPYRLFSFPVVPYL